MSNKLFIIYHLIRSYLLKLLSAPIFLISLPFLGIGVMGELIFNIHEKISSDISFNVIKNYKAIKFNFENHNNEFSKWTGRRIK